MFGKSLSILIVPVSIVIASSFAFGASLGICPSGNGVYTVRGNAMDGVATIDLTVTYDKASLSSPTVSQGSLISGALMVANTNTPGSIRIAVVSTNHFSGSGPVVRISFSNQGTGNVQIPGSKLTDDKGTAVTATDLSSDQCQSSDSAGTPSDSSGKSSADTTLLNAPVPAATQSGTAPTLGTVSMPGDNQPKGDVKPTEPSVTEQPKQTPPVAESWATVAEPPIMEKPVEPAASAEVQQAVYGSILERFRTYQGEKTPAAMIALFAKEVAPAIRQEPAIAISDGKTNVRIIADLPAFAGSSPNFALSGARMVSLKKGDTAGRWILEVLPNKNSMNASVTILSGNSVIEYPLTAVLSGVRISAEESYFSDFLKDTGTKTPKRDLNGDGRHDYLDDYIYTALYLIQKGADKTPKK